MRPLRALLATLGFAAMATAAEPTPPPASPEILRLDGTRAPLSAEQKPVTVLLLWTSMCADPTIQLKAFDALAARYENDLRVRMLSVSIDQAKTKEDLAVIEEIVAPLKLKTKVVSDTGFGVLGLAEGKDYGGRFPSELRVPILAILRDGNVVKREEHSSSTTGAELLTHYTPFIEAELAKLPKGPPKKKRRPPASKP